MAGEREQPRDRVAVGAVPRRGDGDRAGRVGRDELHLDALGLVRDGAAEAAARLEHRCEAAGEPAVVDRQVEEPRPGDLDPRHAVEAGDPLAQLLGDLPRRAPQRPRELERDVRRIVAVALVGRPRQLDRGAAGLGDGVGEGADGVARRHPRIVRTPWHADRVEVGACASRRRLRPGRAASRSPCSR